MWPPVQTHTLPMHPVRPQFVPNPYPDLTSAYQTSASFPVGFLSHPQPVAAPVNTYYPTQQPPLPDPPLRRKRASKPKVRTGCITCKIRRIKCDETKPSCNKCTSTGRKCDGYEKPKKSNAPGVANPTEPSRPPVDPKGTKLLLPASLSLVFQGTSHERATFQRFQVRTIPVLAGGSETGFWYSIVVKVGLQEAVVRDAIIALATLHEDYETRKGTWDRDIIKQPSYQKSLHLYGKALRQLNQRLNDPTRGNAKLAIVSSILFTCFEVMRRNNMAAVIHYQQGMRQLIEQMNLPEDGDSAPSYSRTTRKYTKPRLKEVPQNELDEMLRVFARYDVQACTWVKDSVEPLSIELQSEFPSESDLTVSSVRQYLDNLIISVYQIIRSDIRMYRYWATENVPIAWRQQREDGIQVFEGWMGCLERFFENNHLTLSPIDTKSLLGLRLQIKVAIIMLKTCIDSGPEAIFDSFYDVFEEVVTQVESMSRDLDLSEVQPLGAENISFTMELGVVYPLFYVACKCRDRQLRRRAIAQLKRVGKEGIYEGSIIALLAEWVVVTEEKGVPANMIIPEHNRIHKLLKDVDYSSRVVYLEATKANDETFQNWQKIQHMIPF